MSHKSITFFFPYHEVSGVPVLFYRLANSIATSDIPSKVYIIDYPDGAMARNMLEHPNISLISFELGKTVHVPENSILISQTELPFCIRKELKIPPETLMIFWTLHPDNLVMSVFPFKFLNNLQHRYFQLYRILVWPVRGKKLILLRKYLKQCMVNKAIWFMDQTTLENTSKHLFVPIDSAEFVPVPASSTLKTVNKKNLETDSLNICWIGRLCEWKTNILVYSIQKLSSIAARDKIVITYHIVGDGPMKDNIAKLNRDNKYFKVVMHGALTPKELDSFLLEKIDTVTGMGTSVLEGAKFGIPSIVLDFSSQPVKKEYSFRWLYDTKNYDLGHEITKKDIIKSNESLRNMIISLKEDYALHAGKSYDYFRYNHDLDSVLILFRRKIEETTLRYSDIDSAIFKDGFLRKIYLHIKSIS